MRSVSNRVIHISALSLLGLGVAWAGSLYMAPARERGPDTSQLRELASRVNNAPLPETARDEFPALPAAKAVKPIAPAPAPVVKEKPAAAQPAPAPRAETKKETPAPAAPTPPPAREDPVKNLALMGITHEGGADRAWLVELSSLKKETGAAGERVLGFTVRRVGPESVVLTRGTDEYTLRLGEKQIPGVVLAASTPAEGAPGAPGAEGGRDGRGDGRDGRDGFRGGSPFGGGDSDRRREWESRMSDFRSRFSGGSPSGGFGGFSGGSPSSSESSSSSSDSGSDRRSRYDGSRSGYSGYSGYPGGGFSGFGGYGGYSGRSSSSQNSMTSNGPTSNPQTARRNGGQLTTGTDAIPAPDPISNPQTLRRTGTTNGPAFGETSNNGSSRYGNTSSRTGSSSRSGSSGRSSGY